MPTLQFTLAAVPICLTSDSSELIDLLAAFFRYYQPRFVDETPVVEIAVPLHLTLNFCAALPARTALLAPPATLFSHTDVIQLWRDDENFFFEMGTAAFFVEPAVGRATGYLTRAALTYPRIVANTYTLLTLFLLLRARSVYHLHAAAVLTPGDKLCVIPAAPRAGKTTLATALGLAGWWPVSDDSLLVEAAQTQPSLTPLRKEFHLDEQLFVRWPGLARAEVRQRYLGRACVEALEYFDTVELALQRYAQIDYVIVPQISGEAHSRLEALPASEALLKLAEQSMFLQHWRDHTARQFAALAALMQSARAYQLWCGTDVLEDPRTAAAVLQNLG
jgi:hypothetical protein